MAFISYTTQGFILLLAAASLLAVTEAKTIVLGGSEGWRFGFNYTDWVLMNSPFYINDQLVFKYDPPSENNSGYSVYLLPDLCSYIDAGAVKAAAAQATAEANDVAGAATDAAETQQGRPPVKDRFGVVKCKTRMPIHLKDYSLG